jgi:predicted RND superfamily exporter protein
LSSYALKTEINQNRPNLENYITETELEEILEDYVQDKDLPVASDVQYAEEGHTHTNDNLSEIVKQEVQNILSTEARNTGTSVSKEKFNKTVNIIILTFAILVIVMMVLFYFF